MDWFHLIDTSRVIVFTLILVRVSGIMLMSPVLSGTEIPMQVRAIAALALTLLILPSQWMVPIGEVRNLTAYAILVAAELGIGLSIGLGVNIFFTGISLAGELVGQLGGLMVSHIFDPVSGDQTPLMSRMLHYLGVVVFVAVGGLQVLITTLIETFETLPIAAGVLQPSIAFAFVKILDASFCLAIRMAAPVIVAVLVSYLVIGLLSKTLPQLNIMSIGFSINSCVMYTVLILSLGSGIWCFQESIGDLFTTLLDGLHAQPQVLEPY